MFFFFLNICAEFIDRRKILVLQTRHGEEVGTFTILSIHLYGHLCLSWKHPREVRKGCARKVSLGIMATIWLYHEAVVLLKNSHIEDKRTASFQLSHVSFFFFFDRNHLRDNSLFPEKRWYFIIILVAYGIIEIFRKFLDKFKVFTKTV